MAADRSAEIAERVREAAARGTPLIPQGGGTKAFLGEAVAGEPLPLAGHEGIVGYEPTELVITARAGTPLAEVEAALAAQGQMLGFEPPRLGAASTLGGVVAAGLSGPRRPWAGALRDFVLGVRLVNGRGEVLRFGGQVMKNVAGYDLSRLMAGAQGTLGVLLEVSLRVVPRPVREQTRVLALDAAGALERLAGLARRPLPLAGACHVAGRLHLRLAGAAAGVEAAAAEVGGEVMGEAEAAAFWDGVRDLAHPFFRDGEGALWRIALPPAAPPLPLAGEWLLDWGGGQRFLRSAEPAGRIREVAAAAGGHATRLSGPAAGVTVFHPLPEPILRLHRRLKAALDPHGILNPGRLYPGL
ncbi:glycolate oxidase subunit GlcE [Inmirania thermothiophila]|uniref:Glycolate oxidase FAD binding subunit n=1 Tax=Inmirania thermothiophila TaxID=1750597 RepID=A0A3N1Y0N8_9GAMM|nr:glycolate oxidase subunit GlcE [Inmirania thermothiophila]ROR32404.1 glycolate oxidase FAD binding subunit [Inmirania thermothiophila]